MKRKKSINSSVDTSLKEAGSMLFFTSIVLLMFLGYPSILNTYNGFQNEFAESYDVPKPIPVYAIIMLETIPLEWTLLGHFWFDQESPQYNFGLFPTASADTVNHRITLNADRIVTIGVSGGDFFGGAFNGEDVCDDDTAGYGGGYPANRRMITQNRMTCSAYYHSTSIGEPNIPPDLSRYIDDVIWRARGITGQSGNACDTGALIGVPTTIGGSMTAEQLVDNSTARFSSSTGGCAVARTTFPSLYGAVMSTTGDNFYRELIRTGFYPNGDSIDLGIGMWHSAFYPAVRGVFSTVVMNQNWIEFDLTTIPINATNGLWQLREHSKYPTGTMDDCEFERLGDAFSINTGDTDSQQGQCMIFKVFHKGNVHFEDNFENTFARTTFDVTQEVWDTTFPSKFDINNVTGKIEISVSDTNDLSEGIRFNHEDDLVNEQWVARVNFTNNVMVAGVTQDLFFTVGSSLSVNRLSHADALSMSWTVSSTGEKRFITYANNGALSQDIDDTGIFLNATDQGSKMDDGCIEIARDGREATFSFFDSPDCTGTPDSLTRTFDSGTITDARYFVFHYSDQINNGAGSIDMDIDGIQIWNGVPEVPTVILGEPTIGADVFVNGTGSNEMRWFIDVLDGKHDNTNVFSYPQNGLTAIFETDFSENKFRRNVAFQNGEQTNHRLGITEREIGTPVPVPDSIAIKPLYANGREDFFTVFVGLKDRSSDGKIQMNITKINVGDQEYDFSIPDVFFYDHVIPTTTSASCSQCTPREVQPMEPESDLGFVDVNQTTVAPIVAPALPAPINPVSNLQTFTVNSINVTWIHDQINTTGYRIYRTSTETVDEKVLYNFDGTSSPQVQKMNESPRDAVAQTRWGTTFVDEMVSRVTFNKMFNASGTSGILKGAIYLNADNAGSPFGDETIIVNSTTFFDIKIDPIVAETARTFKFIGTDLINLTSSVTTEGSDNIGIGLSFDKSRIGDTGEVSLRSSDGVGGLTPRFVRLDVAGDLWSTTNGQDLRGSIAVVNQTKLSAPATPFINDTGTLDLFFLDASTISGNTYIYQIFPLNGAVEGVSAGVVNGTQPFIPATPENFAIVNDNINREIDISFNSVPFATKYLIERLSTEREITKLDNTLGDINLVGSLAQAPDRGGDNVGFLEGEIPTRMNSAIFRKNSDAVGGKIETGIWFNLVDGVSTKVDLDLKAEYSHGSEWYASNMGAGERPNRSCVGDTAQFRQDGMTPLVGGNYFDGLCRDQAIFRGNQLHNLTSADLGATEVAGRLWDNDGNVNDLPSGDGSLLLSARSGGDQWNWSGSVWLTPTSQLQHRMWILNQTAEPLITLLGNNNVTHTDDTVLEEHGYFYRIIALNDANESVAPTIYLNQTLSLPPDHVPALNGTVVGSTIELDWDPAEIKFSRTDSGDPIQGYLIQVASGANETRIHEGYGRDFATLRDHPDRTAGDVLTGGFSEAYGQQLNFTSPENVTRFVALLSHTGNAQGNVEPTIQGAIWNVTDGSVLALSQNPKISWNDDRIVSSIGRYVNVIFDPPIVLPIGEYVFGFIHNGLTCSGSCGSSPFLSGFANQELTPRYNNTNNGDVDGFAMFARSGNFPNEQINGTNADLAISVYAEADWTTIGQTDASTFEFTDTSPPSGTKAYRVLPFNDAGIADPPVLAHDPFLETINGTLAGDADGVQGFSHGSSQKPPFVLGTFGKLNIGELFTVAVTTEPDDIVDLVADSQGAQCNLSWTLPANGGEPINGHKILVRVDGGSFVTLTGNTTNALTTFNHTSLVIGSTYEYDVRALNIKGEATGSNVPMCVPELNVPPDPPTALGLTNVGVNVKLDWVAPAQSVDGYKIERKVENGAFVVIVFDTGNTDVTFVDTTVPALGTEVTYRVRSLNFFGESAPSGEATIISSNPPNKPTLMADQVGSLITLIWTEPTADGTINGYKIERQVNFGGFTDLVSNTTNTLLTIDDLAVTKPNTYSYRVSAHDDIPSTGATSNQVDVVFGSHQQVRVREQDGSGYKGFGDVIISNSTFSLTKAIDSQSNVIFDNLEAGLYNYTFKDMDDFVLNRTINEAFPSALTTESFTINALVFDVDCPATIGSDLRIKMNFTNIQDIIDYPATPVCDSSDKVSWSTTWDSGIGTASSQMVADFISARFQTNAENFLVSLTPTSTIYSDPLNRIISSSFNITTSSPTTINFDLFLGEAPPSAPSPSTSPTTSTGTSGSAIPSLKIIFEDRLTGLTLLSLSHMFIQPNDVIDGTITVGWNGESGMRVNRIDVGEFTDLIRFATQTPFMLDSITEGAGETARTEAQVDYSIFIPPAFCDEDAGILLNCLERELIIIPVTFTFEFQGQEFIGQTEVILDAREIPIDIVQLQVIGLGIVVIFSAFVGNAFRSRFKKKNVRKRKIKKKFDSS